MCVVLFIAVLGSAVFTETQTDTETQKHRDTETQRYRHTETQRPDKHTDTQTKTNIHRAID